MPEVRSPEIPAVLFTQAVYRTLLDAMARPGTIHRFAGLSEASALDSRTAQTAAALAITLLDSEVCFWNGMANADGLSRYIQERTFSKSSELATADYLFVEGNETNEHIQFILNSVQKGTLSEPEFGATLFVRVISIAEGGSEAEKRIVLSGPGIRESLRLSIDGLNPEWLDGRNLVCSEYPTGIDLVLFTDSGLLTALPRTTVILNVESEL